MKPEEAIKILERIQEPEPYEPQINQVCFEALEMAIDALKKQIPMKPILCDDEDLTCPTCGADVEWKYYCEKCGQKIDHGEE